MIEISKKGCVEIITKFSSDWIISIPDIIATVLKNLVKKNTLEVRR